MKLKKSPIQEAISLPTLVSYVPKPPRGGFWAVWMYSDGPIVQSVHDTPIEAIWALEIGSSIMFWPYGLSVPEAIEQWDKVKNDPTKTM